MVEFNLVTIIAAIIGSGGIGVALTALVSYLKNKGDSELSEFDAIKAGMSEILDEYRESLKVTKAELAESRDKHERAEQYILLIRDGIYSGEIPPFPPRF